MKNGKVNVAIIGLGFGAEFIPIYQRHPNANMYGICQRTKSKLDQIGDAFGIGKRQRRYRELMLRLHMQHLATRHQDLEVWAGSQ